MPLLYRPRRAVYFRYSRLTILIDSDNAETETLDQQLFKK